MRPAPHALALPRGRGARPVGEGGVRRGSYYERLARVSLRHEYYDATGGACTDFAVRPTAWTAGLMRRLGLLFRAEEAGFSVLYDRLRRRQLMDYLQRDRNPDTGEAWTRLCFTLSSRNPAFVNFTELPVDTSAMRENLYLTNRQAHLTDGGEVLLPPGDWVSGDELVEVTGGQLVEEVDDEVDRVRVLTVSGAEVICKPRCVRPAEAARKAPDRLDCADASSPPDAGVCVDRLFFDLTVLPEERYTVETVWSDPGRAPAAADYLYTSPYPLPLCFVELLFSDPAAGASPGAGEASPPAGVYPVRDLGGRGERVEAVDYVVPFAARRTWWSYYVFARPPRGERGELAIRQVRGSGGPRAAFLGPCCVRMAGGGTAWRFLSTRPLPLEARSPLHLQLVWRRAGSLRADVLVARLPVPAGQQVLPLAGERACEQAWDSLCPGPPGVRCRRLLRSLCRGASPPDPRNFSDIFVHV